VDLLHDEARRLAVCTAAARDDRVVDVAALQHLGRLERAIRQQRAQDFAQRGERNRHALPGIPCVNSGTRFGPLRIVWPPSTGINCPVIQLASSESRNTTARPMSLGSPIREIGIRRRYSSRAIGTSDSAAAIGVRTTPGSTELTRT